MTLRSLSRRCRRALMRFVFDWQLPPPRPEIVALRRRLDRQRAAHRAAAPVLREMRASTHARLRAETGVRS